MLFYLILSCTVLYAIFLFVRNFLRVFNHQTRPKVYSTHKVDSDHVSDRNIRNGYSKRKIPEDIDVIVIGSGISGLTLAGYLSLCGLRVLVLEQHYIAGGSTHAFEDRGYEFDTGIHYIGNIEKRKKILDMITDPEIEWDQMGTEKNNYVYDQIVIGDKTYYLRAGEQNFLDEIDRHFPDEMDNVRAYLADVKKTSRKDLFFITKIIQNRWLAKFINRYIGKEFFESLTVTAQDRVCKYTDNKDLQALLLSQYGDYGQSPSEESFFLHASIVNHYLEGGWYPKGGSTEIAKNIIPIIERTGGAVLVRKAVKSILINSNDVNSDKPRAIGVEMVNGDQIYAKNVVSSCGMYNTWNKLVPQEHVPQSIKDTIENIGFSCSFTYVFIGMEGTPDELELINHNIWHLPNNELDTISKNFLADPENAPMPMFIGFPCAKDSTWGDRFPGKSNAVILTMARFEDFEQWENNRQGHRGKEYEDLKTQYSNRILEEGLYHYFPKTKGRVNYVSVGSPLTFNHYIGTNKGEVYGLKSSPERYSVDDILTPKTHIKNLYQTGQDIGTLGVTGAMMSGVLTAHVMLGYGTVMDLMTGRNLIDDLKNLENDTKGEYREKVKIA